MGPRLTRRPVKADVVMLLALVAVLVVLWGRGRSVWYWLDEGLSVGISSKPLGAIAAALRRDGSPPLYYVLLHGWTAVFGRSESSTHLLSLLFALGTVPAALWAGWSLFGRRVGWTCALLVAVNPFVAYYANETRMYAMVVFLALMATATFLHAFVFRRRRYLPAFAVLLALLLYTHNWGVLFGFGAGCALVLCAALSSDRRRLLLDGVLAFGAVALLYLPWVPTFVYQRAHTGAPSLTTPTLTDARDQVAMLFGGREVLVALGLGAAVGLLPLLRWPWDQDARAAVCAAVIPIVAVGAAWATSRGGSVWAYRYLAAVVAPLFVLVAVGLAGGGRIAVAAFCVAAFLTAPIDVKKPPYYKSNLRAVTEEVSPELRPGDLVIAPDFGQIPLLAHYLPAGLRYADTTGLVTDLEVSDQRDATARVRRNDPRVTLAPLLDGVPVGGHVLFVCPPFEESTPGETAFVRLLYDRCEEVKAMLLDDRRFRLARSQEAPDGIQERPVDGYLLQRAAT